MRSDMGGRGKRRSIRHFSQWSSTFYAAAELTRRGYLVSMALGMAPKTDLLVESPVANHLRSR